MVIFMTIQETKQVRNTFFTIKSKKYLHYYVHPFSIVN